MEDARQTNKGGGITPTNSIVPAIHQTACNYWSEQFVLSGVFLTLRLAGVSTLDEHAVAFPAPLRSRNRLYGDTPEIHPAFVPPHRAPLSLSRSQRERRIARRHAVERNACVSNLLTPN